MATDTFLKNPVLIVGTKQEVAAATIQENDLVAVTDERFYTAEEVDDIVSSTEQDIRNAINESEQDIRNDMNASDSELQTQITAHAGEITTIKGDITTINDGLGDLDDQVSVIESKIPNDTSDSNQLVNKQELTDTVVDIKGDVNQADSELQSQITAQAERIAEIDSEKLDNNLGAINAGKVLTVDSDGNVIAASTTETGGLVAVAHDTSLKGAGKDSDPLGVADSILEDINTTKNDLGDLGDQVSGIEAKIPEDASEQNQLATRNQITELQSSKQDIATAVNYNNITNCITEIPQDIKLEIVDGAVVLKAGSKVYVPNGAGVFDVVNILNDVRYVYSGTEQLILLASNTGKQLIVSGKGLTVSGATDSLSGTAYHTWYDTTNNVINRYNASASEPAYLCSLPIAVITVSNGVVTSIDQVFNGFGYIGSTAFALPGVKALAPNGRNEDGTLKNRTITISAVSTTTDISGATGGLWYTIDNNNITRVNFGTFAFNEELNYFFNSSGQKFGFVIIDENSYRTSGKVTSLKPKQAFRAVDYSEYLQTKNSLDNELSQKVNKSGDTMTGNLGILDGDVIFKDTQTAVAPSTDTWHKSIVQFLDKNNVRVGWIQPYFKSDGTTELRLVSYDPVNGNKYLNLGSNGDLVWNTKPVITTSGGTFTGNIVMSGQNGYMFGNGAKIRNSGNNNQNLTMFLKDSDWNRSYVGLASGEFSIYAGDGTNVSYLIGKSDGTLTWTGKNIALDENVLHKTGNETITGPITTKSQFFFENASSTGHRGFLYKTSDGSLSMGISKSNSNDWQSYQSFGTSGQYQMTVSNGTNAKSLVARSDGTLTWDGYPIVRLVEFRSQTVSGTYMWCRKYSDGWVEQGGAQNIGNNNRTVTFQIPMADKDAYDLQLTVVDKYRYACVANASDRTTTSIVVTTGDDSSSNNDGTINWYVCGYAAQ